MNLQWSPQTYPQLRRTWRHLKQINKYITLCFFVSMRWGWGPPEYSPAQMHRGWSPPSRPLEWDGYHQRSQPSPDAGTTYTVFAPHYRCTTCNMVPVGSQNLDNASTTNYSSTLRNSLHFQCTMNWQWNLWFWLSLTILGTIIKEVFESLALVDDDEIRPLKLMIQQPYALLEKFIVCRRLIL